MTGQTSPEQSAAPDLSDSLRLDAELLHDVGLYPSIVKHLMDAAVRFEQITEQSAAPAKTHDSLGMTRCDNCDNGAIEDHFEFCPWCGVNLRSATEPSLDELLKDNVSRKPDPSDYGAPAFNEDSATEPPCEHDLVQVSVADGKVDPGGYCIKCGRDFASATEQASRWRLVMVVTDAMVDAGLEAIQEIGTMNKQGVEACLMAAILASPPHSADLPRAPALAEECERLKDALSEAQHMIGGLSAVNMQHRDDAQKLRDLAEWRLDGKRVLKIIVGALSTTPAAKDEP